MEVEGEVNGAVWTLFSLPCYQHNALQVLVNGNTHAWPSMARASCCQRINANVYSMCVLFQREIQQDKIVYHTIYTLR